MDELDDLLPVLENVWQLREHVSQGLDFLAKAERAVAFVQKLVEQKIVGLTPEKQEHLLKEVLGPCEEVLKAGALGGLMTQ
mgnify:CR=1 FL=1